MYGRYRARTMSETKSSAKELHDHDDDDDAFIGPDDR